LRDEPAGARARRVSVWVPRTLLAIFAVGVIVAIVSISVGEGGPGAPQDIGGVNDVQRILGGIHQDADSIGPDDAEVTINVFNDVQCSPCATFQLDVVDRLVEDYARTEEARIVFRHFSLAPNEATLTAIASEAAGMQERQWQYIDTFFRNQDVVGSREIDKEFLREVAEAVPNLEIEEWDADYDDPASEEAVREDAILANDLKLTAEPAIVVEGPAGQVELLDTPSYDEVVAAIDKVSA
jgi:protein-disulfide isomerase